MKTGADTADAGDVVAINRRVIGDFARLLYGDKDVRAAFERYVAADYIQHNPGILDGRDAAIAKLAPMFADPERTFDVQRILVDSDHAAIHVKVTAPMPPGSTGAAVADIYRLSHGRIVEHWDVIQLIPADCANPHPFF